MRYFLATMAACALFAFAMFSLADYAKAQPPETWSCTMANDILFMSGEAVTTWTCHKWGFEVYRRSLNHDEADFLARCNGQRYYWDNPAEFPRPCEYIIENPYQTVRP